MNNLPLMTEADAKRRTKAAALIATTRANLATLEFYLAAVPALPGNYWLSVLEDAERGVTRAVRATTCDGHANMNRGAS